MGRGSDFFGPWALDSGYGDRVFYPALAGKGASFAGKVDLPHTATYIEDFGKALVILGEREEALGRAWHVPNDRPQITQRQFAELVFAETGHPAKASGMGKTMMRIGGLFIPGAREVVEMMYEFEKPFIVDSSQFERTFGVKATPIAEAIKATVAWYRAHPQTKSEARRRWHMAGLLRSRARCHAVRSTRYDSQAPLLPRPASFLAKSTPSPLEAPVISATCPSIKLSHFIINNGHKPNPHPTHPHCFQSAT